MKLRHIFTLVTAAILLVPTLAQAQSGSTQDLRKIKKGRWPSNYKPKGWVRIKTRHYEVQSQAGIEKARRLGAHMEEMMKVYKKRFRPGKSFTKKSTIKLLKSRGAFRAYGAPAAAGAYYSPGDREMVCYDTGKWMDEEKVRGPSTGKETELAEMARRARERYKMDILGAAAHEGWHQYFHWLVVSLVQLPSWINEGMGDYFYTARPRKVKGKNKMVAELGRLNGLRLPVIQRAVKSNRHVPLRELLQYSQRQYYSNASVCYAEGWSLCQFMFHGGNKKYARVINKFVKLVMNDTNMPVVTKKAFKGIDLDQLEADWKAWVLKQRIGEKRGSG